MTAWATPDLRPAFLAVRGPGRGRVHVRGAARRYAGLPGPIPAGEEGPAMTGPMTVPTWATTATATSRPWRGRGWGAVVAAQLPGATGLGPDGPTGRRHRDGRGCRARLHDRKHRHVRHHRRRQAPLASLPSGGRACRDPRRSRGAVTVGMLRACLGCDRQAGYGRRSASLGAVSRLCGRLRWSSLSDPAACPGRWCRRAAGLSGCDRQAGYGEVRFAEAAGRSAVPNLHLHDARALWTQGFPGIFSVVASA